MNDDEENANLLEIAKKHKTNQPIGELIATAEERASEYRDFKRQTAKMKKDAFSALYIAYVHTSLDNDAINMIREQCKADNIPIRPESSHATCITKLIFKLDDKKTSVISRALRGAGILNITPHDIRERLENGGITSLVEAFANAKRPPVEAAQVKAQAAAEKVAASSPVRLRIKKRFRRRDTDESNIEEKNDTYLPADAPKRHRTMKPHLRRQDLNDGNIGAEGDTDEPAVPPKQRRKLKPHLRRQDQHTSQIERVDRADEKMNVYLSPCVEKKLRGNFEVGDTIHFIGHLKSRTDIVLFDSDEP